MSYFTATQADTGYLPLFTVTQADTGYFPLFTATRADTGYFPLFTFFIIFLSLQKSQVDEKNYFPSQASKSCCPPY